MTEQARTNSPDTLESLAKFPCEEVESGLKILGAPRFVRKGFPLLGLLATVYEHVSTRMGPPKPNDEDGMEDDAE